MLYKLLIAAQVLALATILGFFMKVNASPKPITAKNTYKCPPTQQFNISKEPWNSRDTDNMNIATKRCAPITEGRSPCLKRFYKQQPLTYRAICGAILK